MSLIASTITKACFCWMLFYVLFGASQTGKDFFSSFVSHGVDNPKVGVPLFMLAFPVLIAASVCALLSTRGSRRTCLCPPKSNRWKVGVLRPVFQYFLANHGDGNFDLYAVIFLIIPLLIYIFCGIRRWLVKLEVNLPQVILGLQNLDDDTSSDLVMEIGNSFGMAAVVAMAFFLVPASKHGPILKLFGWSHAVAIRLHVWCGRAIVVASLAHGLCHTLRWKYQLGEDIQSYLFPPRQCWSAPDDFAPTCKNPETSCTCYDHFLYFTGSFATFLLVIILLTSSNWVRRKCYSFFLTSHLLVGPLFCFVLCFHYKSAILYFSPSLLYYLATSLPPYLERRRGTGVQVVSVDVIGSSPDNKCISLTFEATPETVRAYRPGMYTKLSVPSISSVAHPFTMNRVPGKEDQLRIIFRVMGPFTRSLAALLEAEAGIPTIHLDGLHGCPSRLQQLRHHDTNVLVAGGIGVTPYLSLLQDAVQKSDGIYRASRMRNLSFHWICRDSSLIEYIRREYLMHLDDKPTPKFESHIQIHQTGTAGTVTIKTLNFPSDPVQETEPFRLSRFSRSSNVLSNVGRFLAISLLLWPGLAIILYCYSYFQTSDEMSGRGLAPILLVVYMVAFSFLLARVLPREWFGNKAKDEFKMRDDSDHSYEEILPLTRCPSSGSVAQTMDEESPHNVGLDYLQGRPDLETLLESVDDARFPAIYSCGPATMSNMLRKIAADKSKTRSAVQPSRSSPLVTIYDEAFLM